MTDVDVILADFSSLDSKGWQITSPCDGEYNCIAWAVGTATQWWWPETDKVWPAGVAREETLDAFVAAFQTKGYVRCSDGDWDAECEKIALFAVGDRPTHAARQLPNAKWTSKLGRGCDIEHDKLDDLAAALYGSVVMFMKRERTDNP